jgi:hypothetical protein
MGDHFPDPGEMVPRRIQRRRGKDWRLPEGGATYVGRGSIYGNPFICDDPAVAADLFRRWLAREKVVIPEGTSCTGACAVVDRERMLRHIPMLRGKTIMCWCPVDRPCHGDVLLELANA